MDKGRSGGGYESRLVCWQAKVEGSDGWLTLSSEHTPMYDMTPPPHTAKRKNGFPLLLKFQISRSRSHKVALVLH